MDAAILGLAIFGFTVLLVAVGGYVAFLLGKSKTEKKIAEANIQAVKSAGQTTEAIIIKQRADYNIDNDPDKLLYKD